MSSEQVQELDLRHVLGVLRQRAWLICGLVVVSACVAFVVSSGSPKLYQSTATVRISNPNSENLFQNQGGQVPIDPKRQVETETQILQSNDLRKLADEQLGDRAAQVQRVTVSNEANTDLLDITVTSTSPEVAREAADTYADVYVQRRKERAASELDRRATELRAEANRLAEQMRDLDTLITRQGGSEAEASRTQKAALQSQQTAASNLAFQLGAQAALMTGAVEVADRAVLAPAAVAPRPTRDALLAAGLALLIGIGAALLVDRLDDRISSTEDLARAQSAVPLLASLPIHSPDRSRRISRLPSEAPRTLVPLNSVAAEAYRTLRSNVRYSNIGQSKKILMVTSSSGAEGKTTVTANLAVALAENGQRVVVMSADLRRPTLATIFGVDESRAGITSVLHGDAPLTECLVPVTLDSGCRLYVLPAGPIPHNPAELLGSGMMADLLESLARADVDYILVDTPPVLPVSDPLAVAQHVDGVIMLAAAGRTRARNLVEACNRLDQVGADVLGIVLNGVPLPARHYPYYQYRRADLEQYGSLPPPPAGAAVPNGAPEEGTAADQTTATGSPLMPSA